MLAQRVEALEARIATNSVPTASPWTAADELFDQGADAVAFRRHMDEEVQNARAADRAELGLDTPHVVADERQP